MNILHLTFYFDPDLSAGSFRNTSLVDALSRRLGADDRLDVVTTLPNRYATFSPEAPEQESRGRVTVERVHLPSHQSGMADQARSFAPYARRVLQRSGERRYDLVMASSSRLMTASLGALVARRQRAPLYLDIRDIFSDSLSDVLKGSPLRAALPGIKLLEKWTIRNAARVNLVSPGFREHFEALDPTKAYRLHTNGIDEAFLQCDFDSQLRRENEPTRILYAGNLGAGQGLHHIIPPAAQELGPDYEFRVLGDGGKRQELEDQCAGLDNVTIRPPVPRDELLTEYANADILFLHLNDLPAFRKVLPSKLFEYAATGRPILAGVSGEAEKLLNTEVDNAAVFHPCDVNGLVHALNTLSLEKRERQPFIQAYRRDAIMDAMAQDILALAQDG